MPEGFLVTLNYCETLAALLADDGCVLLLLLGCCDEDELCGVEDDEAELAGVLELKLLVVDWATDELVALDACVDDEYVLVLYVAWYAVELDDSELDDFFL